MPDQTAPCPECTVKARQIATETVRNMVEPFENQEVKDEVQYRICKTTECPVVYFTEEVDQQFGIDVIRETPNFKLDTDERPYPLCYCFGYGKNASTKTSPRTARRILQIGSPSGYRKKSVRVGGKARSVAAVSETFVQRSPKRKTRRESSEF
ncbi:hypothetical protein [Natronococcus wangiae]|uniref:hypothetical protein n=1 Tax=Natronococcus wangiae TaxID=3068275 RepID=UPI00387E4F90